MNRTSEKVCALCADHGLRIVIDESGERMAIPCSCVEESRSWRLLSKAGIPKRYEHCTLGDYETSFAGANPSLILAQITARKFVEAYPIETDGIGLLLTGSIGVGKTHLAVGILRELVLNRGASGLFCDYREMLKQIQNSYNPNVQSTEMEVLAPVFDAEVLVLDELGAVKPTEWVGDMIGHILNTRYNDKRTTIVTTNYLNSVPLSFVQVEDGVRSRMRATMREETLGDRIGERMRSRLQEMCAVVEMQGEDFRQKVKPASFLTAQ